MSFIYKIVFPFLSTTLITTILMIGFSTYFIFEYSLDTEQRMLTNIDEYGEVDIHHLCNLTSCNGIFFNGKYYGIDSNTKMVKLQYTDDVLFADELLNYGHVSLRKDLTIVISILPQGAITPAYFFVATNEFIPKFFILYIILLVILNIGVAIILRILLTKEKILHNIESSKDKTHLQFSNLMFYIENINHEVNSPLFVLSRKVKELKDKVLDEDKTFEIIFNSIEQINAVMQRTREVKRINKVSEDRTIYDLIESTILTVSVMRSENIINHTDIELDNFYLDQKLLSNGTFINILTNHVKNSIEAYASNLTSTFITMHKHKLSFTFADDGNGIPKEYRKKVFEKGFSTKGSKLERGSGMSINKDIIESVGGSIKLIESDIGTTFELTIPIKRKK